MMDVGADGFVARRRHLFDEDRNIVVVVGCYEKLGGRFAWWLETIVYLGDCGGVGSNVMICVELYYQIL